MESAKTRKKKNRGTMPTQKTAVVLTIVTKRNAATYSAEQRNAALHTYILFFLF